MNIEQFVEIQRKAISEAEDVDCDIDEFRTGLAAMWHELNERLETEGVDPKDEDILNELSELE